jgi:hypothetical protein
LFVSIISDKDKVFTSKFWKEYFSLAQVQLSMSSAYHPQSDRQTKRLNQCMETFLRCFANACPRKWLQWVPLAEFWYNTSFHTTIGRSPFDALYGYSPQFFGVPSASGMIVSNLDQWL